MSGCSWYNLLSFGQSVDLIVSDKAGFVWLLNFGCTLLEVGGGALDGDLVSIYWPQTRHKIVWLLFSFRPALTPPPVPPTLAIVKQNWHFPISKLSAGEAQDCLFHSYSPWYVFGSSCSRGELWSVSPLCRLVLFSPQQDKAEGPHQAESQGRTLGCPWPCLSLSLSTSPDS